MSDALQLEGSMLAVAEKEIQRHPAARRSSKCRRVSCGQHRQAGQDYFLDAPSRLLTRGSALQPNTPVGLGGLQDNLAPPNSRKLLHPLGGRKVIRFFGVAGPIPPKGASRAVCQRKMRNLLHRQRGDGPIRLPPP